MGRTDREEGRESGQRSLRDRVRKREKERQSGGRKLNVPEGVNFWKKPENTETKTLLDFIPYVVTTKGLGYAEPGEVWWEKTFWTHWGVGGGNGSVVCPSTVQKKCPICEHVAELKKLPKTPETDKIINSIKAKERQIFNVVDRKAPDKGIQIYEDAYFNFGKELKKELDDPENEDKAGFADLKHGFTVKVRWDSEASGQGGKNYLKAGAISFVDRDEPLPSKLSEKAIDLDKALVIPTYEELLRLFNGAEDEDEDKTPPATRTDHHDDEDEDEEPAPPRKRSNDEDEDEAPPKKTKKPTAPVDDEEDEDEDEEPEDEEDPDEDDNPPRRGRR